MSQSERYYSRISLKNHTPEDQERILQLFEDNKNIAYKIASKYYKTKYWDFDEALQIAQLGLWKACLIWDPTKFRLSTLAYNIINRDFSDHDKEQKRQPPILFNVEDNVVTEDLCLSDVLVDPDSDVYDNYEQQESLKLLNQNIINSLDEIAEELNISKSIVKIVYVVQVESNVEKQLNQKQINFIPKKLIKQILSLLQQKLTDVDNL